MLRCSCFINVNNCDEPQVHPFNSKDPDLPFHFNRGGLGWGFWDSFRFLRGSHRHGFGGGFHFYRGSFSLGLWGNFSSYRGSFSLGLWGNLILFGNS